MHINSETKSKINTYLRLKSNGDEQDWELELADKSRINEFLNFMMTSSLSSSEKYALMALIFASYDDYLSSDYDDNWMIWNKIKEIISSEKSLYLDLLNYWSLPEENTADNLFAITPLIRNIL